VSIELCREQLGVRTEVPRVSGHKVEGRPNSLRVTQYYGESVATGFRRYQLPELPDTPPLPTMMEKIRGRGREIVIQSVAAVIPLFI
jgi:hypothetical protein